jgi:hypothetical protein
LSHCFLLTLTILNHAATCDFSLGLGFAKTFAVVRGQAVKNHGAAGGCAIERVAGGAGREPRVDLPIGGLGFAGIWRRSRMGADPRLWPAGITHPGGAREDELAV